ncbi:hypothetical protein N7523_000976 [Penicillium sp. IBT 18751x]|nr:hypothetical protein N7523_000976 [Penicillium sp. IBT 18751x]
MRPGSRRVITFCKLSATASLASVAAWELWTRNCYFETFGPENDALFQSPYFRKFNPRQHPSLNDSCVRKVPFSDIEAELVADARQNGSKLTERFCAGMWGGFGYAAQRNILRWLWRNESNHNMLWDKKDLLNSTYEEGTIVTDHFIVLKKTPGSIVMRGGMSPAENQESLREMDNLSEITVNIDFEQRVAEFRLKNIFFNGVESTMKPMFPLPIVWLHYQYCKLLVESAVGNCTL